MKNAETLTASAEMLFAQAEQFVQAGPHLAGGIDESGVRHLMRLRVAEMHPLNAGNERLAQGQRPERPGPLCLHLTA